MNAELELYTKLGCIGFVTNYKSKPLIVVERSTVLITVETPEQEVNKLATSLYSALENQPIEIDPAAVEDYTPVLFKNTQGLYRVVVHSPVSNRTRETIIATVKSQVEEL